MLRKTKKCSLYRSVFPKRTNSRPRHSHRGLRFEALEDRKLLAVIPVNSLADGLINPDDGQTTLREALAAAHSGDIVDIQSPGTINLTQGELLLGTNVTIRGHGATINAQGSGRVFDLAKLVDTGYGGTELQHVPVAVEFDDLTITGGNTGGGEPGAAINGWYGVHITLSGCTLSGNTMATGGVISVTNDSTVELAGCTITGNNMQDGIGWIIDAGGSSVIMSDTRIVGNGGAGVAADQVTADRCEISNNSWMGVSLYSAGTFTDCTISNNGDVGIDAGGTYDNVDLTLQGCILSGNQDSGIVVGGSSGTVRASHCTITDNGGRGIDGGSGKTVDIRDDCRISGNHNGGIGMEDSDAFITNCVISGNTTEDNGGGVFSEGSLWITDSQITDNTARNGGGIYQDAYYSDSNTITIAGSVIANNSGFGGGICSDAAVIAADSSLNQNTGGGIYSWGAVTLTDCSVSSNTGQGGITGKDGVSITRCTISANQNDSGGGGLDGGPITAVDSMIEDNRSKDAGGGILGSQVTVTNCTIGNNQAEGGGGGIYADRVTAIGSTIDDNSAKGDGGGIDGSDVTVTDSSVSGNQSAGWGGGIYGETVSLTSNSDISGNSSENQGGGIAAYHVSVVQSSITGNTSKTLGGGIAADTVKLVGATMSGNRAEGTGYKDCPRDDYGHIQPHGTPTPPDKYDHDADIDSPGHNVYCSTELQIGGCSLSGGQGSILYIVGEEPEQPPSGDPMAAVIKQTQPIGVGESVTLDASGSYSVDSFSWDLNGDGAFDNGSGATLTLSWADIENLGWKAGTNYVTLDAIGDNQQQAQIQTTVVVVSQEDPSDEILARDIAYKTWAINDTIGYGYYEVKDIIQTVNEKGFYAIELVRSEASGSLTQDPIFVFRGSEDIEDFISDTNPQGVGYDQFIKNRDAVTGWIKQWSQANEEVKLVGHSLGGALAQWFAADWTSTFGAEWASTGYRLKEVITYNSPGISDEYAGRFNPALCGNVVHNIVNGDVVSMAGEAFIEGTVQIYSYSDLKVWEKHSRPLQTDHIGKYSIAPDIHCQNITTAELNDWWFHYTDPDYLLWLTGLEGAYLLLPNPPVDYHPALAFFRVTAESLRKSVGSNLFKKELETTQLKPLKIESVPIVPGKVELKDVTIAYQPGNNTLEVGTQVKFCGITAGGTLGFKDFSLNSIEVGIADLNKPIGATGLFLQEIDAKIDHFSKYDREGTSLGGKAKLTYGPQISVSIPQMFGGGTFSGSLMQLEGTLEVSMDSFKLGGKMALVTEALASADATLEFNWTDEKVAAKVNGSLLGGASKFHGDLKLGFGTGYAVASLNATASLCVPNQFPWIGGTTLSTTDLTIHYSNDGNSSNDIIRWEYLLANNYSFMLQLGFDGHFDYRLPWSHGGSSASAAPAMLASPAESSSADTTFLRVQWADDTPAAAATFVLPDGSRITENDLASRSDIVPIGDLCTVRQRIYAVEHSADEVALWTVEMSGVAGEVTQSLAVPVPPPSFAFTEVAGGPETPVSVSYTLSDPDADLQPTVTFWLDTDDEGFDGIQISPLLTASDAPWQWTPQGVPSGTYYLYAEVDDGTTPLLRSYSATPVQVTTQGALTVTADDGAADVRNLSFQSQVAGETKNETRSFTLHNTGNGPLQVGDMLVESNVSGVFTCCLIDGQGAVSATGPLTIAAGASVRLQVTYQPTDARRHDLCVSFQTSDPANPTVELLALGTTIAPAVTLQHRIEPDQPLSISADELLQSAHGLSGNVSLLACSPLLGTRGQVAQTASGVVYTPPSGYTGQDRFMFTLINDQGELADGVVTLAVGNGIIQPIYVAVTIDQASAQQDPAEAGPIHFTVVFSEPVSDFTSEDVSLAGSTAPGTLTAVVTPADSDGMIYDVAVGGMTGDGTVTAGIDPGVAHDAAGNPNSVALSTDASVVYRAPSLDAPEIAVEGQGHNIGNGQPLPNVEDGTDFGSAVQGNAAVSRTFTVRNTGTTALILGTPTLPGGLTISEPLDAAIEPGGSDDFTVLLSTADVGSFQGDICFSTNDGDENPFRFRVAGEVVADASEFVLVGTAGDDLFVASIDPATGRWTVLLNGQPQDLPADDQKIVLDGLGGQNTFRLLGSPGDDVLTAWMENRCFQMNDRQIFTRNVAATELQGGGGRDAATIYGGPGMDVFELAPGWARVNATELHIDHVARIIADSAGRGQDTALLFDSPSTHDTFEYTLQESTLTGGDGSFQNTARGFWNVQAYATPGGQDTAVFHAGSTADTGIASPYGAVLYAKQGEDTLADNSAWNFQNVMIYGQSGGDNSGVIYDAPGSAAFNFRATPGSASLDYGKSNVEFTNFRSVTARALSGNATAYFYDTPGAVDTFTANPQEAVMSGANYSNRAAGFAMVQAYASPADDDCARLSGSDAEDVLTGSPLGATLQGGLYNNQAWSFKNIQVSGGDGNDIAYLYGALEGTNALDAQGGTIRLSPGAVDHVIEADDFDAVMVKTGIVGKKKVSSDLTFNLVPVGPWEDE
jgi:hypothetical protein